jgi:hypothetical protein
VGAAAEGPHPEYKLPSVSLEANYELAQVRASPYFSHQDHVLDYAVIGDKTSEMNVAVGIN